LAVLLSIVGAANPGERASPANQANPVPANLPQYTADGQLKFPANYREWVYLSTGIDMNYRPNAGMNHSMFDNVFVNPESYKYFVANGTWPDKTMLVLGKCAERRPIRDQQGGALPDDGSDGREVHVKDESRFPGKWRSFGLTTPYGQECFLRRWSAIRATRNTRRWIRPLCSSTHSD